MEKPVEERTAASVKGTHRASVDGVASPTRRRLLVQGAAATVGGTTLVSGFPFIARSRAADKPLGGTTLNVSCWSAPYPKYLADYVPEFEQASGAKVNYETPSFPIYNQRTDVELSTKGTAYDVLNITFIYAGRWIGAGWFEPLDGYMSDPKKTPPDWNPDDFLGGTTASMKDKSGRLYGIPWIADVIMSGAARADLIQKVGKRMPATFDEVSGVMKAVHNQDGVPGFIIDNHYGWTWIPWLQGFGGNVFRDPPGDLMPTLDTPEAIAAADFFANLLTAYGPNGVISYTYDQVVAALKQGRANWSPNNQTFLVQMGAADSKVASTCDFALFPAGPKGRFPAVSTHAWGIPVGSKNKDAAWEFIKWAMSKEIIGRMVREKGYTSITRRSLIEQADFKQKLMINGRDVAKIYLDTVELGASGYMKYRTVPVYPQVDKEIDIAIQNIASKQMSAKDAMQKAQANAVTQLRRSGIKL